jgi:sarcosine oxidase subunit delta
MLILNCPYCGIDADETDLHGGGQAHLKRETVGAQDADFEEYLFIRDNPMGVHFERWRHVYGCGKWFLAARDTVTLEVFGTYKAQTLKPPQAIVKAIKKKRPDWEYRP